jgi:hypothetical protein
MRLCTPKLLFPLLLLSAALAHADSFTFSYLSGSFPGLTFSGTFDAQQNGNIYTASSPFDVTISDGTHTESVSSQLFKSDYMDTGAVLSSDVYENDFALVDASTGGVLLNFGIWPAGDDVSATINYFGTDIIAVNTDYFGTKDAPVQSGATWHFGPTGPSTSVPDGGSTAAMLVVSCAALGLLRRRR